jgi:dissimilatory sulfite reductase (desulfoviridin) alpha/beta subunit
MPDYIRLCGHCGCREFCVTEAIDWIGEVDDDGILGCKSSGNSIDNIHCAECGAPYSSKNFANLEFN